MSIYQKCFCTLFLSAFGSALVMAEAAAPQVGDVFPSQLVIGQRNGETLTSPMFKGKVVVVNFWATWCDACKVELVEMKEQFAPFFSAKKDDFAFFMVSLDKDAEAAKQWIAEKIGNNPGFNAATALYFDPEFKAAEALGVDAFPMTFVIGRDSKIRYIQREFSKGKGQTENLVKLIESL